jgi:hypothetical protein
MIVVGCASAPKINKADLNSSDFYLSEISFNSFIAFSKNGQEVFPLLSVEKVVATIEKKYDISINEDLFRQTEKAISQIDPKETQSWTVKSANRNEQSVSLSFVLSPNFPEMYVEILITYIGKDGKKISIKDFTRIYDWSEKIGIK